MDDVEKYCRAGHATDSNMAHTRCTLSTQCYTHIHTNTQCVIVIAFPLQLCLHERVLMLLQAYIGCLCYDWMFSEALPVYNWQTITRIICWSLFILYRPNKALGLEAVSISCSQSTHIAMVTWNEIFAGGLLEEYISYTYCVFNIRMDFQEVGCGYMGWIGLAQDRDRWRRLVSAVMNLRVPWNAGNFLTSCKPVSFSKRTLHHGVRK